MCAICQQIVAVKMCKGVAEQQHERRVAVWWVRPLFVDFPKVIMLLSRLRNRAISSILQSITRIQGAAN